MVFSCLGAGYGTALAGRGIAAVGAFRPEIVMKVCAAVLNKK